MYKSAYIKTDEDSGFCDNDKRCITLQQGNPIRVISCEVRGVRAGKEVGTSIKRIYYRNRHGVDDRLTE